MQSTVRNSAPESARNRITELSRQPGLTETSKKLLQRLDSHPAMKSEVWDKLPLELKNQEAQIINWVFYAFATLPLHIRPPMPRSKSSAQWKKYRTNLEQFPPPAVPVHAANHALKLAEAMAQLKPFTELLWARHWQGDVSITFDQAFATVNQLQLLYRNVAAKYDALIASLPKVLRWDDKAHRRLSIEFLSQRMKHTVGRPHDAIVAALVEIAFDLSEGIPAEAIRGRRRTGTIPAKSNPKSR